MRTSGLQEPLAQSDLPDGKFGLVHHDNETAITYIGIGNSTGKLLAVYRNFASGPRRAKKYPAEILDFFPGEDGAEFIEDGLTPTPEPDFIEDDAPETGEAAILERSRQLLEMMNKRLPKTS
jgi:hypothetical protein